MSWLGDLYAGLHELMTGLLHWVEAFADSPHATWALLGIAFVESSFFPIPPDVLLIALAVAEPSKAFYFAGLCSLGSVVGGMLGYAIGFYGGRPVVQRLFSEEKVAAVHRLYDRYNAWATGIAGLTPLPYKLFTISGGAFEINFKIFVLASVISRSLRFFAVGGVIYVFGEPAKQLIEAHLGWLSIAFVILLLGGFYVVGKGFGRIGRGEGSGEGEA